MASTTFPGSALGNLAGCAFPFLNRHATQGLGRLCQWLSHFAALAALVIGLWILNGRLGVGQTLGSRWPQLQQAWLPLFFLLSYVTFLVGAWCWSSLLKPASVVAVFADIEHAWGEALQALQKANIDIQEAPVYLVLGRAAAGDDALFQTSAISLNITGVPAQSDSPVRVYASHEAVFVACAPSSLLGSHATLPGDSSSAQVGEFTSRFRYLCQLLTKSRRPYCPINGLLVLVPLAAALNADEAGQVAELAGADLRALHQELQIDCPVFALVCDLEKAPGFREFIEALPDDLRRRPLGQRFPLIPDVDAHEMQGYLQSGLDDLCRQIVPEMILPNFRSEGVASAALPLPASVRTNFRLYQFLAHMRTAGGNLGRVLYHGTQLEPGTSAMLAGCYFLATGRADRDQAFAADVFQQVLHHQNYVAWSPQALSAEAGYRQATRLGYGALGVLIVVLGLLGAVGIIG